MDLPESFQYKGFREWNELVRGLMEAWSVSQRLGIEHHMEQWLRENPNAAMIELIATLGSDCLLLASALRMGLQAVVEDKPFPFTLESELSEPRGALSAQIVTVN